MERNENENMNYQNLWDTVNGTKKEVDSNIGLPEETRKA